jgi:hypothetical protein
MVVRPFRWLSSGDVPPRCDLRRCGWRLIDREEGACSDDIACLAEVSSVPAAAWIDLISPAPLVDRRSLLLVGVAEAGERARLLRLGFGDVMAAGYELPEVEARAEAIADRLVLRSRSLPRLRCVGPVQLDLALREAFVGERPLRLNPREFALLWHLAERPGHAFYRAELMQQVWRLSHVPETNSLAVHVHRLRTKLALAGCGGLVQTDSGGGYLLCPEMLRSPSPGRMSGRLAMMFM